MNHRRLRRGAPLPPELVDRLSSILGDELPAFLDAYDQPAVRGLRLNPRKIGVTELQRLLDLPLAPVPWCPTGFRLPDDTPSGLGDHRAHRAGLFYLQEPSAMSPAEILAAGLGHELDGARVIDLAAAPGGKTTRLTELVGADGLVVANEIESKRLRVLHENLDRWGAANVVTISRPIDALASNGDEFDAALLDAPCTGEGLFRRDPDAVRHWSPAAVRGAARRQAGLLDAAAHHVRPGGVLVYSTCTFAVEENEDRVAAFLDAHPEWSIEDCHIDAPATAGVRPGDHPTDRAVRLWPHRVPGEGQFAALLRRDSDAPRSHSGPHRRRRETRRGDDEPVAAWARFGETQLRGTVSGPVMARGDQVFLLPATPAPLPTEALARPGVPLGRARPGRFEPAQALAGLLTTGDVALSVDWPRGDPRWPAYLRGEEIPDAGPDGWVLVGAHGWGLGWARRRGGVLKNFLPAALRSRRHRDSL